jgi:endonuclease YncB( thermonuclease family)
MTEATAVLAGRRFFYGAVVRAAHDGDTVTVDIDLGYKVWLSGQTVRLAGIDCAELRGGGAASKLLAVRARDWLRAAFLNCPMFLDSTGKDSFGRWLGVLYDPGGLCLNDELVRLGLAVVYRPAGSEKE